MQQTTTHPNKIVKFSSTLKRSFFLWENPFSAGLLTALIFLGFASLKSMPWRISSTPYYNYLADAFLHGRLNLRIIPIHTMDLSFYQGKYFLYWGPLPAVIAMPFVAIFGSQFSDVLQSIAYMAANVIVFAVFLRILDQKGWVKLVPEKRAFIVLFFTLGTALTPLPAVGGVWYLVQLASVLFALFAYLAVFAFENEKAFFLAGSALIGILLTRPSAIFIAIFLLYYLLIKHTELGIRRLVVCCIVGAMPVVLGILILLTYNALRFGNPFELGSSYHLMANQFGSDYKLYGLFNLHYVPINLYYNFLYQPIIQYLFTGSMEIWGGSLFLLSPLFFGAIYSIWQDRKDLDTWVLLITIIVTSIPVLMIMAPGSAQFGPRYALDFVVPLLLLTARGIRRWPNALVALCVVLSVLQYLVGVVIVANL